MKIITLVTGMAAAGAVGVGGTYWKMHEQAQTRAAQAEEQNATTMAGLRAELAQLKAEVSRLQATAAASQADSALTELRALVHATEQKTVVPSERLLTLTDEGKLKPETATLFALSAAEKSEMEGALGKASASLTRLIGQNLDGMEASGPGQGVPAVTVKGTSFAFRLKPFPEAGGKVHDELVGSLRTTLESERYAALMTLMGPRFESAIGRGFGSLPRKIVTSRVNAGPPGMPRYIVRDEVTLMGAFRPDAAQPALSVPTSVSSSLANVDRAKLERDYPEFVKLLPADF